MTTVADSATAFALNLVSTATSSIRVKATLDGELWAGPTIHRNVQLRLEHVKQF